MSTNSVIAFVYCGVALASSIIMIFNAQTVKAITARYSTERNVYYAVLFSGLAAIFDCAYTLRETEAISFSQTSSYLFTLAYVICISLCGMFWVFYSEKRQNSRLVKSKKIFLFYSLPMVLLLVIIISTPFTHLYFYFEGIHYQRGPLFIFLSTILFLYVLQTGLTALIRSFKKENYVDRKDYRRLFSFAAVYIVIQIVQLTLPQIFPYRSVGTMLFFEVFLIRNMTEMIGRDPLTHINNRFAAERQLGALFNSNDKFEFTMLDVDKFKSINDQFGHQEGDKALQYVASALENSADGKSFIARMGGDEFVIINDDIKNSIENIEEKINNNLEITLKRLNRTYGLTVSVGYVLKDESIKSIPDLIELADSRMYSRKNHKKS